MSNLKPNLKIQEMVRVVWSRSKWSSVPVPTAQKIEKLHDLWFPDKMVLFVRVRIRKQLNFPAYRGNFLAFVDMRRVRAGRPVLRSYRLGPLLYTKP